MKQTLSEKECNILVNRIDLDKLEGIAVCPECKLQKSLYFVGKPCLKCSVQNNEGDPLSGWKKEVKFLKITVPVEKLNFQKGFFKEKVKEFIKDLKTWVNTNQNITRRQKINFKKEITNLAGAELTK